MAIALFGFAASASAGALPTPTNVTAVGSEGAVEVYFDAVSPPSGTFYTYTVTASPGGKTGVVQTNGPSPGFVTVSELTDGQSYTFTVVVSDESGDSSAPSAPSNSVTPGTVPNAPDNVAASATDGQASVSFDESAGGSPATTYSVIASPGGAHASGTSSPITVTGLSDGTAYTFAVTATNALGGSAPSTPSNAVTPLPPPSATSPPAITGTVQVGLTLQVSDGVWSAAPNQFAIQWYDCDPGDTALADCTAIDNATASQYTVTPLDGGAVIEAAVTATNADTESATAASGATATVVAQPGAPVLATDPTIGTPNGDAAIAGTAGTWSNNPSSYSFVWFSCAPDLSSCAIASPQDASSGPDASYIPVSTDAGNVLFFIVVASNASGASVAEASPVTATPVSFAPPTVTISYPTNGANLPTSLLTNLFVGPTYSCSPGAGAELVSCAASPSQLARTPGSYSVTVTAQDNDGKTASETVSYTVGAISTSPTLNLRPPVFTPTSVTTAPAQLAVSGLTQSAPRWHLGKALPADTPGATARTSAAGTRFSFTTSVAAQLFFSLSRQESGRKQHGKCVAQTRKNVHKRVCTRAVGVGSFSLAASSGANTVTFDGVLPGGERLAPGAYTVTISATDSAGAADAVGTLHFTIVK